MGNTASWGSDLLDNVCDHVLDPRAETSKKTDASSPPCLSTQSPGLRVKPAAKRPHPRFKYHMCKHYKKTGHCRYGAQCKFAHSKYELYTPLREFCKRRTVHLTLE
jgi:hypothetical protein